MHAGHRQRMKQRFAETGLLGFDDLNALELLLFYAVPRQDTNPIAHALIDRFGSLNQVLEASLDELQEVEGVGANTATLLKLVPAICQRYLQNKGREKVSYTTISQLQDYIIPLFAFEAEELLYLICMDSANHIIHREIVSQGNEEMVFADPKTIARIAMKWKASRVVLAHNHPSGLPTPSASDIALTKIIQDALDLFNIELMDHFVVSDLECSSMRKLGLLS